MPACSANIVASLSLEAQASVIGSEGSPVTLFTPPAAGFFRLSAYLEAHSDQVGSIGAIVNYTDDEDPATLANVGTATANSPTQLTKVFRAEASTPISYYTAVGGDPGDSPDYNLYLVLEQLQ